MSYDTRNPFAISTAWGQNTTDGYGPYEYSQEWLTVAKNGSDFNETTSTGGLVTYSQLTTIGGGGGTVPELYNWTAVEDLSIGGHKFWNDNQNFTAGVDEALAVRSDGGAFVAKPKRTTSSFVANLNSRAVFFALVPS